MIKIDNNDHSDRGRSSFIIKLTIKEFLYDLPTPLPCSLPNKRVGLSTMWNKDKSASSTLIRKKIKEYG